KGSALAARAVSLCGLAWQWRKPASTGPSFAGFLGSPVALFGRQRQLRLAGFGAGVPGTGHLAGLAVLALGRLAGLGLRGILFVAIQSRSRGPCHQLNAARWMRRRCVAPVT